MNEMFNTDARQISKGWERHQDLHALLKEKFGWKGVDFLPAIGVEDRPKFPISQAPYPKKPKPHVHKDEALGRALAVHQCLPDASAPAKVWWE